MTARTAALFLALAACAPSTPEPVPAPTAAPDETPVVTLERTPCFGTCPVYQVALYRSGLVRYVGRHHVAHSGNASAEIPPARVDSLLGELEAGGYFGFADDYVMDSPDCGMYATDSPSVITTVTAGDRRKTIRHDYGCNAAPRDLARLERMIDEVAGSARWTGP
jgi:Domain of unknown function (DUF6438)